MSRSATTWTGVERSKSIRRHGSKEYGPNDRNVSLLRSEIEKPDVRFVIAGDVVEQLSVAADERTSDPNLRIEKDLTTLFSFDIAKRHSTPHRIYEAFAVRQPRGQSVAVLEYVHELIRFE